MSAAAESICAALDAIVERIAHSRCVEPSMLQRLADENAARRSSRLVTALERTDRIAVLASMRRLDRALAQRLEVP